MAPGLILLGFLGLLCAFFVHRARRRMGLGFSRPVTTAVITAFVLIVLVAWVAQR